MLGIILLLHLFGCKYFLQPHISCSPLQSKWRKNVLQHLLQQAEISDFVVNYCMLYTFTLFTFMTKCEEFHCFDNFNCQEVNQSNWGNMLNESFEENRAIVHPFKYIMTEETLLLVHQKNSAVLNQMKCQFHLICHVFILEWMNVWHWLNKPAEIVSTTKSWK